MKNIEYRLVAVRRGVIYKREPYDTFHEAEIALMEEAAKHEIQRNKFVYLCVDELSEAFFVSPDHIDLPFVDTLLSWDSETGYIIK